uniref:Uncharacterized protein n=1 Tax=Romanomermis culicivorax TaxID=13658 RepID=A0A915IQI5_ROMCU
PHPDDVVETDPFLTVSDRSLPGPSILAADRSGLVDETSWSASNQCLKKTDIVTRSNYSKRLFSFEHLFDRASSTKRNVSYSTTKFNSYGGKFIDQIESIEFHHSALSKYGDNLQISKI